MRCLDPRLVDPIVKRLREVLGRLRVCAEVERGLDELELHEHELPLVSDQFYRFYFLKV